MDLANKWRSHLEAVVVFNRGHADADDSIPGNVGFVKRVESHLANPARSTMKGSDDYLGSSMPAQCVPRLDRHPFISSIFETLDKRHVVPSAVYVDLVYQWSTFLRCAVNATDVATEIKRWSSSD